MQILFSTISNIFPKMDFKDKNGICCTQKTLENTEGAIKKNDSPEKLATQDTEDKDKQNKNTTQYVLDTTILKQTQTT